MKDLNVSEIASSAERLRELIAQAEDFDHLTRFSHVIEQFEEHARHAVSEEAKQIRTLLRARRGVLERG